MMKRYLALLMSLCLLCLSACSRSDLPGDGSSQTGSVNDMSSLGIQADDQSSLSSSSAPDGETADNTSSDGTLSQSEPESPSVSGDLGSQSSENRAYAQPTPLSYDDLRISPAVEYMQDESSPSSEFLEAVRAFSYASSAQILSSRAENTVYCPTSVYYSMALLAAGTGGATRDQILSALGLSGQSNDAFTRQCQLLYCNTRQDSEDTTFLTANSL